MKQPTKAIICAAGLGTRFLLRQVSYKQKVE